jgi:hypothetical protein
VIGKNMADNPKISSLLRLITAIEVWVLIFTGFGLFLFYGQIAPLWPWVLTPFNAGFLGAIYLAALLAAAILVKDGHWFPARMLTAMIFAFTAIVLLVSLAYLNTFEQTRIFSVWGWFILYAILPINAAYQLWLYRQIPQPNALSIPIWLRNLLLLYAIAFASYGFALLIIPVQATSFWPWAIDEFHGRMYSVAAITPAVGTFLVYRNPNLREMEILALTQIVGGVLPILGLVLVDLSVHRINWLDFGTWLWISFSLLMLIVGILTMREARKWRS